MILLEYFVFVNIISSVYSGGLLLLYRPKDITRDCAFSRRLRYDISYGMGMSDTVTLVFRSLNDIDYECLVEIVTSSNQYLLVVVRYPTTVASNCAVNRDAVTVLKRWRCVRLCDLLDRDIYSPYYIFYVKDRLRFLFKSNSSINSDINANFYQVTITSARLAPRVGCNKRNETLCVVDESHFCFTSGVVCDGIKNCGVDDWFDERKSQCNLPVERLGFAPVIAVTAALICAFIAGGHALMKILPSPAQSFFIFNANEDNRFCIDPLLVPKDSAPETESFRHVSIIPVSLSSESDSDGQSSQVIEMQTLNNNENVDQTEEKGKEKEEEEEKVDEEEGESSHKGKEIIFEPSTSFEVPQSLEQEGARKSTVRSLSEKIQDKFKVVTRLASKQFSFIHKRKTTIL